MPSCTARWRWAPVLVVAGLLVVSIIPVLIVGSTKQPNPVSIEDFQNQNLPRGCDLVSSRGRSARGTRCRSVHLHAPRSQRRLAGDNGRRDRRPCRPATSRSPGARMGHGCRAPSCRSRPTSPPSRRATIHGSSSPSRPFSRSRSWSGGSGATRSGAARIHRRRSSINSTPVSGSLRGGLAGSATSATISMPCRRARWRWPATRRSAR